MTIISFIAINFGAIYRTTKSSYRDSPSSRYALLVCGAAKFGPKLCNYISIHMTIIIIIISNIIKC